MARKPSRIRRTFTPQFKKDAVALVAGGRSVNEVAHDLGIARSLLQRWRTGLPAPLSHARGGAPGDLRVHRGLLQSHPSALEQWLSLTRRTRKRTTSPAGLNRVSTFLGQLQSAACAG
jgi:hypothetical protein